MNATEAFGAFVNELEERVYQRVMKEIGSLQPEEKWLPISEAAELLGVSSETIQRLCKMKVIPHVPIGAPGSHRPRILISQRSLSNYMRSRERASVHVEEQEL